MIMIELKQDMAIETYVTKERQYKDNLHIYLFIIKRRTKKKRETENEKRRKILRIDSTTGKIEERLKIVQIKRTEVGFALCKI